MNEIVRSLARCCRGVNNIYLSYPIGTRYRTLWLTAVTILRIEYTVHNIGTIYLQFWRYTLVYAATACSGCRSTIFLQGMKYRTVMGQWDTGITKIIKKKIKKKNWGSVLRVSIEYSFSVWLFDSTQGGEVHVRVMNLTHGGLGSKGQTEEESSMDN